MIYNTKILNSTFNVEIDRPDLACALADYLDLHCKQMGLECTGITYNRKASKAKLYGYFDCVKFLLSAEGIINKAILEFEISQLLESMQ